MTELSQKNLEVIRLRVKASFCFPSAINGMCCGLDQVIVDMELRICATFTVNGS